MGCSFLNFHFGKLVWFFTSERIGMPTDINRDEVQNLMADIAQLVEVLPAGEYGEAHLPGAVNLPLKKMDGESVKSLDRSHPVITYCSDFQ